jgi:hypothetical protein
MEKDTLKGIRDGLIGSLVLIIAALFVVFIILKSSGQL